MTANVQRFAGVRSIKRAALWHRVAGVGRAQAALEFAIIAPVLMVVLLVGVQFAISVTRRWAWAKSIIKGRAMPR